MLSFLLLAAPAVAGCPWAGKDAPTVSSTMTTVTVNGALYSVKGKAARTSFAANLHECNADAAIVEFDKWRFDRRQVNAYALSGAGLVVVGTIVDAALAAGWYPTTDGIAEGVGGAELAVGVPIFATQADKHRRLMMAAITASKPPRK